jgi:hypothetical protein
VADAMDFMRMARPQMPANGDIRPARGDINGVPIDDLAVNPSSPNYRSKLPPPPCVKCGEDHVPNRTYDHGYVLEEPQASYVHAVQQGSFTPPPQPAQPNKRMAVYVGRNDMFVVAVEEAPDWDATATFKVPEDKVMDLVKLARALGVKVQDKTGGELSGLSMDASESA